MENETQTQIKTQTTDPGDRFVRWEVINKPNGSYHATRDCFHLSTTPRQRLLEVTIDEAVRPEAEDRACKHCWPTE